MKISFAPLTVLFLLPSAFADDNGGLKKIPPRHLPMHWMKAIAALKMQES